MIQIDIRDQMKQAMIEKDGTKLNVLRGLLSAFTNELVAKKRKPDESLSDEEAMEVIRRNVKQRKDSIEQFEKGGRSDLAESEKAELLILEKFLPPQMTQEEVLEYVKAKQAETGMADKSKAGQFMGSIMKDLKGKTDGQTVKEAVDSLFL
jgi:uncharacterized protein YqeY